MTMTGDNPSIHAKLYTSSVFASYLDLNGCQFKAQHSRWDVLFVLGKMRKKCQICFGEGNMHCGAKFTQFVVGNKRAFDNLFQRACQCL